MCWIFDLAFFTSFFFVVENIVFFSENLRNVKFFTKMKKIDQKKKKALHFWLGVWPGQAVIMNLKTVWSDKWHFQSNETEKMVRLGKIWKHLSFVIYQKSGNKNWFTHVWANLLCFFSILCANKDFWTFNLLHGGNMEAQLTFMGSRSSRFVVKNGCFPPFFQLRRDI